MKILTLLVLLALPLPLAVETVTPNDSHTNGDGVEVDNHARSRGNVEVDPSGGDGSSATTVTARVGAKADIQGVDANDTVALEGNTDTWVSGVGAVVYVGPNSTCTVVCREGGPAIVVYQVGSSEPTLVAPGTEQEFETGPLTPPE